MHESRVARGIGLALIGSALLFNPLFIGLVFSIDDRVHLPATLIFIGAAELFFLGGGIFFLTRGRRLGGRTAYFTLVLLLVIPAGVELGLQLFRLAQHLVWPPAPDRRMGISTYRDKPWAGELFRETHELTFSYDQYLGWRTREYHGRWITVEKDGLRKTTGASAGGPQVARRLFLFGGSSMWGAYVRDEWTIASLLQKKAREAGLSICVSNYAEQGYTFTQGVLRLLLLIREGKIPDVVIFYDGFNDVVTAETTGKPGQNSLTAQFEELVEMRRLGIFKQTGRTIQALITQNCMLYKCAERLAGFRGTEKGESRTPHQFSVDSLSGGILREYLQTYALLDSLSRTYHISFACVLQPDLYTKIRRSTEEETVDDRVRDNPLRSLFETSYAAIRGAHLAHWFDLSSVFDAYPETVYSDLCHVSEEANGIIADTLIPIVRGAVPPAALEQEAH
ncbi:MAG TPA: hypothetical protein VL126_05580 [Bacteroidota bacterium]|nr:hypothetical protein [Bacteroidota bacterium]